MTTVKRYDGVYLSSDEVFSFLGIKKAEDRAPLESEIMRTIKEITPALKPRLCYELYPISLDGDRIDLGFTRIVSHDLAKDLSLCQGIVLVAATVGLDVDRLISKYSRIAPSRAVILQAAGAAAVESLLDTFSAELEASGLSLRPRFSCGYGDLPLSLQKDIFTALDCPKSIGVSLTDSFLMTPTKSVSAIIGIYGGFNDRS